jgi:hypothetical protein
MVEDGRVDGRDGLPELGRERHEGGGYRASTRGAPEPVTS